MKRNLIGTLTLVVASLMLNTTGAYAQSIAKGDVPFTFMVGKKELPSGRYAISTDGQTTMTITNLESGTSVLSLTRAESPSKTSPKLVFHYVGNQYFLSEVWGAEGRAGMVVPTSALEKELRIASGPVSVGQIEIALK